MRLFPPQSATIGKALVPSRLMQLGEGLEGLCSSINAAGNTIIVGCSGGKLVCVDAHTMLTMDTIELGATPTTKPHGSSAVPDLVPSCTAVRYIPAATATSQNVVIAAQGTRVHHVHVTTGKVLRTHEEGPNNVGGSMLSRRK